MSRRPKSKTPQVCAAADCTASFLPRGSGSPQRFCSRRCRRREAYWNRPVDVGGYLPHSVLTYDHIQEILTSYNEKDEPTRVLAQRYGVSEATILRTVRAGRRSVSSVTIDRTLRESVPLGRLVRHCARPDCRRTFPRTRTNGQQRYCQRACRREAEKLVAQARRAENHRPRARALSQEQVREIRERHYLLDDTARLMAKEYHVSPSTIVRAWLNREP